MPLLDSLTSTVFFILATVVPAAALDFGLARLVLAAHPKDRWLIYGSIAYTLPLPLVFFTSEVPNLAWTVVAMVLIVPLMGWLAFRYGTTMHLAGHCRTCGYNLYGSPGACPECGASEQA
jgi:hypothetical protein